MPLFNSAPKSLCILRLSAIGDVCHAISVVQAIQAHWPKTEITWVCGKIEAQLISDLPNIRVVVFDKKLGFKGMRNVWKQLSSTRFDALLHMQAALRASALSFGIKAKYKVGFGKNRTKEGQWLFTNKHLPKSDSFHVLDNFADFARFIGVPFNIPKWNIPLSEEDQNFAASVIPDKTIIISPAASKDERNWIPERYAKIADYVVSKGWNVALCGSPSEREQHLGQQIIDSAKVPIINLIGKTNLKQLVAIIQHSQGVLAPDSGPAHIATTQSTPVIGLYAHSNPLRTGPYVDQDLVVSTYEIHIKNQNKAKLWGTRAKGSDLMRSITIDSVSEKIDILIKNNKLSDNKHG
ncbi:glycosyltransferase family 9 protein [Vibrio gallicus]|uniref:glycosyltransferase family 9 protein n=1 Tax=Vibrio gallicus TaxID=190897 RepID=UPI0021C3865B|nr:glycosyltransferase family 9 protein [Vibrio gallicus]